MRSKIHFHKVAAILGVKFRAIANGNMAVMPIFIIVLAVVLRFAFKSMGGGEVNSFVSGYILNFGLTFNIGSMGIFLTSAILAEEKEKNTLRVLMTSSVNGAEFFIGSILPIFTVMMAVNVLVLLVSGIPMETVNLWMFLGITAVASLTACIFGMLLGIFTKNQVAASTLSTPFLLLVTLLPAFSSLLPELKKVCVFLFTGVVAEMAESYAAGQGYQLSLLSGIVLAATAVLASALFLLAYKDHGYEKE